MEQLQKRINSYKIDNIFDDKFATDFTEVPIEKKYTLEEIEQEVIELDDLQALLTQYEKNET